MRGSRVAETVGVGALLDAGARKERLQEFSVERNGTGRALGTLVSA